MSFLGRSVVSEISLAVVGEKVRVFCGRYLILAIVSIFEGYFRVSCVNHFHDKCCHDGKLIGNVVIKHPAVAA